MAAYPFAAADQIVPESTAIVRDDLTAQRSPNGGLEPYANYSVLKRTFHLHHVLTAAAAATFRAFYATNRLLVCTLTYGGDGASYSVRFAGAPREEWTDGRWAFDVELLEA